MQHTKLGASIYTKQVRECILIGTGVNCLHLSNVHISGVEDLKRHISPFCGHKVHTPERRPLSCCESCRRLSVDDRGLVTHTHQQQTQH